MTKPPALDQPSVGPGAVVPRVSGGEADPRQHGGVASPRDGTAPAGIIVLKTFMFNPSG